MAEDSLPALKLDEVIVKASPVVNSPRGYTIRIAGEPVAKGKNSIELLGFLPNISVEDETVKINGTEAYEIRINGRKIQNISELQTLSAQMIESVKVQYVADASSATPNSGGTIDIRLKPAGTNGLFGSMSGDADCIRRSGLYNGYAGGAICARIGKLGIYEAPFARWLDFNEWSVQTVDDPADQTGITDQYLLAKTRQSSYNNNLALNYSFSRKHDIGIAWYTERTLSDADNFNDADGSLLMDSDPRLYSNVLSANYSGSLNDRGDDLSFTAEWMHRNLRQAQHFNGSPGSRDLLYRHISDIYELNMEYGRPAGNDLDLNLGLTYRRAGILTDETTRQSQNTLSDSEMRVLAQTPLAYASLTGKSGVFRYYGALSWQLNSVRIDSQKARIRGSVNPTIQLSVSFGPEKRHTLTVVYKHILDQIPYDALSAKKIWSDAYNYYTGNISLKAPSEDFVSAIMGLWDNRLNISASFSRDDNTIFWQTFNDPDQRDVFFSTPVNIAPVCIYALRAEYIQKLYGVLTLKAISRVALNTENMELSGIRYSGVRLRQYYSLAGSLNLNSWGAGLNAYIEPTFSDMDRKYHTVYQMECSIYKTLLNDRLQIMAEVVPFERRRRLSRRSEDRLVSVRYTTPMQCVSLRMTWYFSCGKKDIRMNVRPASLNYQETKDNL